LLILSSLSGNLSFLQSSRNERSRTGKQKEKKKKKRKRCALQLFVCPRTPLAKLREIVRRTQKACRRLSTRIPSLERKKGEKKGRGGAQSRITVTFYLLAPRPFLHAGVPPKGTTPELCVVQRAQRGDGGKKKRGRGYKGACLQNLPLASYCGGLEGTKMRRINWDETEKREGKGREESTRRMYASLTNASPAVCAGRSVS